MNPKQGDPTVLKAFTSQDHAPNYPWIGLCVGAGAAVLLAYPLVMVLTNFYDYCTGGAPFNLLQAIGRGLRLQLWPFILLSGCVGGLAGWVLGYIFHRIKENRMRLNNLHHEFELQVTTLRHHYKNLALGIQGFSNRIKKRMTSLEEHFNSCAREECITFGQFYQDFASLQQNVAILEDTSQRLTHTLGQELLFLKALTSDSPAVEPQDFYPFLERCVQDLLDLRFRDKQLRVEINGHPLGASPDRLILPFDPSIMEVILQNILTNAMKKGDHIQIRVKDRNEKVRVEVQDNGPGLDLAKLQCQLMVTSRSPDAESTHLGLKVTLHLLEKSQGRLMALSQPGEGATFIIEIPKRLRT